MDPLEGQPTPHLSGLLQNSLCLSQAGVGPSSPGAFPLRCADRTSPTNAARSPGGRHEASVRNAPLARHIHHQRVRLILPLGRGGEGLAASFSGSREWRTERGSLDFFSHHGVHTADSGPSLGGPVASLTSCTVLRTRRADVRASHGLFDVVHDTLLVLLGSTAVAAMVVWRRTAMVSSTPSPLRATRVGATDAGYDDGFVHALRRLRRRSSPPPPPRPLPPTPGPRRAPGAGAASARTGRRPSDPLRVKICNGPMLRVHQHVPHPHTLIPSFS